MNSLAPKNLAGSFAVRIIAGHQEVLKHRDLLIALAGHFGQPTAMHGVEHYLQGAGRSRRPYLLLAMDPSDALATPTLHNIHGAALFYEFRPLGIPSRIFFTEGKDGMRSIIAPADRRAAIANALCEAIIDRKATLLVASFTVPVEGVPTPPQPLRKRSLLWASSTRSNPGYLPLRKSLEATLQTINRRTRIHFRYYRRRLEAAVPLDFIADAKSLLTQDDLLRINSDSFTPVTEAAIRLRHQTFTQLPDAFICGLRTVAGEWIALLGGWRQSGTTVLQWQINAHGYEFFSLVTVGRSFWIEHEIAIGSTTLRIDGGTNHSMSHSFVVEEVMDLMLRRNTLLASFLVRLAPLVASGRLPGISSNFLAETLARADLRWNLLPRRSISAPEASPASYLAPTNIGTSISRSISPPLESNQHGSSLRPRTSGGPRTLRRL